MSRVQSRQSVLFEAFLPSTDVAPITPEGFRERRIGFSLRQTKYESRTPNVFGWQHSRARTPLEFAAFMGRNNESWLTGMHDDTRSWSLFQCYSPLVPLIPKNKRKGAKTRRRKESKSREAK